MVDRQSQEEGDLVTRRLAGGEIAIWDKSKKAVHIIDDVQGTVRTLQGHKLRDIENKLGDVVVLV